MKLLVSIVFALFLAAPYAHAQEIPALDENNCPPGYSGPACSKDQPLPGAGQPCDQNFECAAGNMCDVVTGRCVKNGTPMTPTTGSSGAGASSKSTAAPQSKEVKFVPLTDIPAVQNIEADQGLAGFFNYLYVIAVGVAAAIAVLQFVRAGIMYAVMSTGVVEKREARSLMVMSVMGLLLVLSPAIVFGIINPDILSLRIGTTLGPAGGGASSGVTQPVTNGGAGGTGGTGGTGPGASVYKCSSDNAAKFSFMERKESLRGDFIAYTYTFNGDEDGIDEADCIPFFEPPLQALCPGSTLVEGGTAEMEPNGKCAQVAGGRYVTYDWECYAALDFSRGTIMQCRNKNGSEFTGIEGDFVVVP